MAGDLSSSPHLRRRLPGAVRILLTIGLLWLVLLAAAAPALAYAASAVSSPAEPEGAATRVVAVPATTTADSGAIDDPDVRSASREKDPARSGLEQALRATFAATAFSAIGVLSFVLTVWDGSRPEFELLCRVIERAALIAAVVAVLQLAARTAATAGGWSGAVGVLPSIVGGAYGSGMLLRAGGAVVLAVGASILRRTPSSTFVAIVGASLVVGSFALAGYAADAAPQFVSVFAIVAHVAAAAAWGGGLLALVITLTHRSRAHRPLRAGYVAARFSVLATYAVALAAGAGVALAAVRLDSVAALWTTAYGLTLVAKVVIVGLVAAIGTYNHFVVVPVLRTAPDHHLGRRLRWLGSLEVALFVLVVGINATLVGLGG